jgi:hypothetical protein
MDYLTKYYKHLCEQLQEKLNIIEMQLNEAGVKKALQTKDPVLLRKEILKGEERRKRTQQEMEDLDVSGVMQEYGASAPEVGPKAMQQEILYGKIKEIDKNLDALEKSQTLTHTTGSQPY